MTGTGSSAAVLVSALRINATGPNHKANHKNADNLRCLRDGRSLFP
jgi:hypothetical protein